MVGGGITSLANKLGGWERENVQRAAKRYDDDGHDKIHRVETAAACCCYFGGESAPPANEQIQVERQYKRHGAKILAALCRVGTDGYGAPWNFQPIKT